MQDTDSTINSIFTLPKLPSCVLTMVKSEIMRGQGSQRQWKQYFSRGEMDLFQRGMMRADIEDDTCGGLIVAGG